MTIHCVYILSQINFYLNQRGRGVYKDSSSHTQRGIWRWGEREIIYLTLHCHHQNDFCVKVGTDESHFKVLYVRTKSQDSIHRPQPLK